MFLLQTYTGTNVIKKVQTYSNVLSIPVKMFFNHLTAWLKPYRKKTSTVKKFKTVNGSEFKKKKPGLWLYMVQANIPHQIKMDKAGK